MAKYLNTTTAFFVCKMYVNPSPPFSNLRGVSVNVSNGNQKTKTNETTCGFAAAVRVVSRTGQMCVFGFHVSRSEMNTFPDRVVEISFLYLTCNFLLLTQSSYLQDTLSFIHKYVMS